MKTSSLIILLFLTIQLSAQQDSTLKDSKQQSTDAKVEALLNRGWGSQEAQEKKPKEGKLKVEKDSRLDLLLEGYKKQKTSIGYRIQIYSGRTRKEATDEQTSFYNKYGQSEMTYLIYQPPNFKVRVGNYRDRLKATQALELFKVDFPSAFLVKDEIELPED
ncbi:MAG: hypothetical protein CMP59_12605 [Flavobacteriales bacterium]|nr:hypothetical protein [Flavobacteriales bacterium]